MDAVFCPSYDVFHEFWSEKQREETHEAIVGVDPLHLGAVCDDQMLILVDSFKEICCMSGK